MANAVLNSITDAVTSDILAERTNPLKAIDNVWHTTLDATLGAGTNYIADVAETTLKAVVNVLNTINPNSYKRNGFKNVIKAPAAAVTQWVTALKNLTAGLASALTWLYTKWVQDNLRHLENGTVENIPYVWEHMASLINFFAAVPWMIPAGIDGILKFTDKILDGANEFTLLEWQKLAVSRMRI